MTDKERLQVNIRMDGEQALYALVKQEAARQNTSVNQFIINSLKIAVGLDNATQSLDNLQPLIDKALEERLAGLGMLDNSIDNPLTKERIEEIIDQRVAHLVAGMNQLKDEIENQMQFLKTEIDFIKQQDKAPEVRPDAQSDRTSGAVSDADVDRPFCSICKSNLHIRKHGNDRWKCTNKDGHPDGKIKTFRS